MIIEASQLLGRSVATSDGTVLGSVERCVFDGRKVGLFGFLLSNGWLKRPSGLDWGKVTELDRQRITIAHVRDLESQTEAFQQHLDRVGSVFGVRAATESGRSLGRVSDVYLEAETGLIVRFHLKNLLSERIIPRQYLVGLGPKEIIFKDVVDDALFDQTAATETVPST